MEIRKAVDKLHWEYNRIQAEAYKENFSGIEIASKSTILHEFYSKAIRSFALMGDGALSEIIAEAPKSFSLYLKTPNGLRDLKNAWRMSPGCLSELSAFFCNQLEVEQGSGVYVRGETRLENVLAKAGLLRKVAPISLVANGTRPLYLKKLIQFSDLRDLIETACPYALMRSPDLASAVIERLSGPLDFSGYSNCAFSRGVSLFVRGVLQSVPKSKVKNTLVRGFSHEEVFGAFESFSTMKASYLAMYAKEIRPLTNGKDLFGFSKGGTGNFSKGSKGVHKNACDILLKVMRLDQAIREGDLSLIEFIAPDKMMLVDLVQQGVYTEDQIAIYVPKREQKSLRIGNDFTI